MKSLSFPNCWVVWSLIKKSPQRTWLKGWCLQKLFAAFSWCKIGVCKNLQPWPVTRWSRCVWCQEDKGACSYHQEDCFNCLFMLVLSSFLGFMSSLKSHHKKWTCGGPDQEWLGWLAIFWYCWYFLFERPYWKPLCSAGKHQENPRTCMQSWKDITAAWRRAECLEESMWRSPRWISILEGQCWERNFYSSWTERLTEAHGGVLWSVPTRDSKCSTFIL